jgi:hypothetical protein
MLTLFVATLAVVGPRPESRPAPFASVREYRAALVVAGPSARVLSRGFQAGIVLPDPDTPLGATFVSSGLSISSGFAREGVNRWSCWPDNSRPDVYFNFGYYNDGVNPQTLSLELHSRTRVATSPGWISLVSAVQEPFKVVFHVHPDAGCGWGSDMIVTITDP